MNKKLILSILAMLILLTSCVTGNKSDGSEANTDLNLMIESLKQKFPGNTSFHSIMFSFDEALGNNMLVKIASNPDSAKVQEWFFIGDKWEMTSEKVIETDSSSVSALYFNVQTDFELSKLSEFIQESGNKLKEDKKLKNPHYRSINLVLGNQIDKSKAENIVIQFAADSEKDSKTFFINFDGTGKLLSINE